MAGPDGRPARPRIGLLGVMQELYDEMLPGITERQAGYAQAIGSKLSSVADVQVAPPARNREDVERTVRAFEAEGLDGRPIREAWRHARPGRAGGGPAANEALPATQSEPPATRTRRASIAVVRSCTPATTTRSGMASRQVSRTVRRRSALRWRPRPVWAQTATPATG